MSSEGKTYRIAIVGGGIVGVCTAYHLARRGMTDVLLVERTELTAGSTWHAAGNLPNFSGSPQVMRLQNASIRLYREIGARHGDIGHHITGSIRLAHTRDRMDEFHRVHAMARQLGIAFEMLAPDEIARRYPGIELHDLVGGLWDPEDGHIDPTSVTNAIAREARGMGVAIMRNAPVEGVIRRDSGRWELETPRGAFSAEILVNAAGFRSGEIAAMVGHPHPVVCMEHQYLVTEDVPELVARAGELPLIRDPDTSYYMRQERKGFIIGPYEHDGRLWALEGVPPSFGQELLPPDLDRIADHVADAMARVPMAAAAGIRTIINGPITYTADGLPLIGPAHGVDNYFLNCGSSFGIVQGGGSGLFCAEWILDGEPSIDLWECDPRRFGGHATKDWVAAKSKDLYDHEYTIGFPFEFAARPAGRPAKTTPATERHRAAGAVFTTTFGWERPAFFGANGEAPRDHHTFRRPDWFETVAGECRAVRERVGLLDLSPFSKFEISGPGAERFLDGLGANRMPRKVGGICLTHALNRRGGVVSEFTVTRLGPQRFYAASAAAAERHDEDLLRSHLPGDGAVEIRNITADYGAFVLAGPRSRDVLAMLTNEDLSSAAFSWLTGREMSVAGIPTFALRVNYVGELGWELHHPLEHQLRLYDALTEAGREFGLQPFGLRATDSLRLEKMYRGWRSDLTTERSLIEAGMDRFIRFDKDADFAGRAALLAEREAGPPTRMALLEIDADGADAIAAEPVFSEAGEPIGAVTTGGYGHHTGLSLALAYLDAEHVAAEAGVLVEILGERRPARLRLEPVYDSRNERLRA